MTDTMHAQLSRAQYAEKVLKDSLVQFKGDSSKTAVIQSELDMAKAMESVIEQMNVAMDTLYVAFEAHGKMRTSDGKSGTWKLLDHPQYLVSAMDGDSRKDTMTICSPARGQIRISPLKRPDAVMDFVLATGTSAADASKKKKLKGK